MFLLASLAASLPGRAQNAHFVDPFLGASGGGNVFPGPALPFGMMKPGPDMTGARGNNPNSGWNDTGAILGFSQTHVSGTGGGDKYGNILVMPTTGNPMPLDSASQRQQETASAGYYAVTLARYGVEVEITTAARAAIYRFHYPAGTPANLLFDVGHCLISGVENGEAQSIAASSIQVLSPTVVSGWTSVVGGWNKEPIPYKVYFYAVTDTPAANWGTWTGTQIAPNGQQATGGARTSNGAWLQFAPGVAIEMKIGISFISVDKAKQNLATEIPAFDFVATQTAALRAWDQALSKIDLKGETPEQAQLFYTALYHAMLMPVDRTGENPLWQSDEPYYNDYYAIWDIFRSSGPLLTLITPERQTDIVRSLVDIYRHEGWLPDARSGNYTGRTQGGSNAEFLITDAFVKGLSGIDWKTALAAERHDAETPPSDHFKEGRGGLDDWSTLGYASIEGTDRPGSASMEYAADDFEIALLAKGQGDTATYNKYLARSGNWKKLWDRDFEEGGFTGFIRPRHRDGSWLSPFTAMDSCSWGGNTFYEGNSWTYSFFVPQDVAGLIAKTGGAETFVRRLDSFFDVPGRYDVGNEPGFLSPYLYIWAGRPDKTDERIRQILAASYHAGPKGLPGNDDSGAMSSWYAFGQIGLYPNAGQDLYLIGSPAYRQTTLHLSGGRDFVIEARNQSDRNLYVVDAALNGKPLHRAWLRHNEIASGGRLILTMSDKPGHWGEQDLPPSTPAP